MQKDRIYELIANLAFPPGLLGNDQDQANSYQTQLMAFFPPRKMDYEGFKLFLLHNDHLFGDDFPHEIVGDQAPVELESILDIVKDVYAGISAQYQLSPNRKV